MAKEKLTVDQVRVLLAKLNPKKFGANADPVVPQQVQLILTGKISQGANGEKVEQYIDKTKLADDVKKANPGLTETRYLRILKTDNVKEITSPDEIMHTARRPIADNLFERQQPLVFEQLMRLLRIKDEAGNPVREKFFTKLEPDPTGLPRLKMRNPLLGAFVVLNVPGYFRVDANGNILKGSRKDISTNKMGNPEKQVFRTLSFFVHEHDLDRMEEIAISQFQRMVEPMLATELKIELSEVGTPIKKDITANVSAEEEPETETPGSGTAVVLDENGFPKS